jgi:AraC-like DNA-binding protein
MGSNFAKCHVGVEKWTGRTVLPRHRHESGYVSVVLRGSYEEAGDSGRHRAQAGNVIVHAPFEAHLDRFSRNGAQILNLPIDRWDVPAGVFRVAEPDAIVKQAEKDVRQAVAMLFENMTVDERSGEDWPERLASDLCNDPSLRLVDWAERNDLAPATLSRGFALVFGIRPCEYRLHARTRKAWRRVIEASATLSEVALEVGFSDQAHMTRAMGSITGRTPARWRAYVKRVQDGALRTS